MYTSRSRFKVRFDICFKAPLLPTMRYLVLDFETTGCFDEKTAECHKPLPREDFPTQVALQAINIDGTQSTPLFNTFIIGAIRFDPRVAEKVPFTVADTQAGMPFAGFIKEISKFVKPDDILCGHHLDYDVNVLRTTAADFNVDVSFILNLKRFDTQLNEYTQCLKNKKRNVVFFWKNKNSLYGPSLDMLCSHLNIDRTDGELMTHDARKDVIDTAKCIRVYIQEFGLSQGSFPKPFQPRQIGLKLKRKATEVDAFYDTPPEPVMHTMKRFDD
jgi:DNA polymerase III epsilon subunit-like protein